MSRDRVRGRGREEVWTARGLTQRRLHKAFLRYHDPENWPILRDALKRFGRGALIGGAIGLMLGLGCKRTIVSRLAGFT